MSGKVSIVIIICLVTSVLLCRASAVNKTDEPGKDSSLRVYLPREITIKDDSLKLGQISIIRGAESLAAKAGEIAFGRISVPGQQIVIDRAMVLSRLACNGIPTSKVILTGAEKVTVKQQQRTIKGSEFAELAGAFLTKNPPAASVCRWDAIRIPKDLTIPTEANDIKLFPRLGRSSVRNQAKVHIAVLADGKEIGACEIPFRLKYHYRKAVTTADIPAGTVISSDNVKIEKTISNEPEPAGWKPPYGLIAKRRLCSKTTLLANMVGPVKPAVIVGRNKNVLIRIKLPGLLVTVIGKTLQDGRAGEYIKVRNVDSQRILLARVNEDGSVEPIL